MAVYVDAPIYSYGRMKMCHMVADSHDELIAMADRIGVARRWIQKPGRHDEHFDVCKSKRAKAVACGAQEVSALELGRIIRAKRAGEGVGDA